MNVLSGIGADYDQSEHQRDLRPADKRHRVTLF